MASRSEGVAARRLKFVPRVPALISRICHRKTLKKAPLVFIPFLHDNPCRVRRHEDGTSYYVASPEGCE